MHPLPCRLAQKWFQMPDALEAQDERHIRQPHGWGAAAPTTGLCCIVRSGPSLLVVLLFGLVGPQTPSNPPADAGTNDAFAAARGRMVRDQLAARGRDITNARVLAAMGRVPRHEFTPERCRAQAYEDGALPLGYGQTISQPYVVAFMTEQLEPKPGDRVLEIGTGSGYQAAVLAELVAEVRTIEIVEPLARRAEADLKRLGYQNVKVRAGDGYQGWSEAAPFDAIIVTCASDQVPPPLIEQIKDGGRLILPLKSGWGQELVLLRRRGGELRRESVLPVRFVPMTGQAQREGPGTNLPER